MYLLDTDHVVVLQSRPQGDFERLVDRMSRYEAGDFYIPVVTFHEQMLGWNAYISRAADSAHLVLGYNRMYELLDYFRHAQVLQFDAAAAEQFERLRAAAIRVGTMD